MFGWKKWNAHFSFNIGIDHPRSISGRSLVFEVTSDEESAAYAWRENSGFQAFQPNKQNLEHKRSVWRREAVENLLSLLLILVPSCCCCCVCVCVFFPFFPNGGSRSSEMVVKKRDSHWPCSCFVRVLVLLVLVVLLLLFFWEFFRYCKVAGKWCVRDFGRRENKGWHILYALCFFVANGRSGGAGWCCCVMFSSDNFRTNIWNQSGSREIMWKDFACS